MDAVHVHEGRELPEPVELGLEDGFRVQVGAEHAADRVEVEVRHEDDGIVLQPRLERGDVAVVARRGATALDGVVTRVGRPSGLVVGGGVDRALDHHGAVFGLHGEGAEGGERLGERGVGGVDGTHEGASRVVQMRVVGVLRGRTA